MTEQENAVQVRPIERFKSVISSQSVQEQFRNALADGASLFVASLIDIYGGDAKLQKCAPGEVVKEALKAATLKLPINKNLGFAYVLAYDIKKKEGNNWIKVPTPQFQLGYKGFIQLAMRTGQYRYINADMVYEGEKPVNDRVTGSFQIEGEPKSDKAIGYFAYFETLNGFNKAIYWSAEKVRAHAKKYSPSFKYENTIWHTNFEAMALKTVLKNLLSKYGILSVEMVQAMTSDIDERSPEDRAEETIQEEANTGPVIDIPDEAPPVDADFEEVREEAKAETKTEPQADTKPETERPDW